jgi:FMN phosphatase YigB (HAD superfamily)
MKPKVIACDLDYTLTRFLDAGMSGLEAIFTGRGADPGLVKSALAEANEKSFSFSVFHHLVEHRSGKSFPFRKTFDEFVAWLRTTVSCYDDTHSALMFMRSHGIAVSVITFGDPRYQRQKLNVSKIPHDDVRFAAKRGDKWQHLEALIETYETPIIFVDDCPAELDAVRENGLMEGLVRTVRMRRADSPHIAAAPKYDHRTITTLFDLIEDWDDA